MVQVAFRWRLGRLFSNGPTKDFVRTVFERLAARSSQLYLAAPYFGYASTSGSTRPDAMIARKDCVYFVHSSLLAIAATVRARRREAASYLCSRARHLAETRHAA
jgi:hypothetical protein